MNKKTKTDIGLLSTSFVVGIAIAATAFIGGCAERTADDYETGMEETGDSGEPLIEGCTETQCFIELAQGTMMSYIPECVFDTEGLFSPFEKPFTSCNGDFIKDFPDALCLEAGPEIFCFVPIKDEDGSSDKWMRLTPSCQYDTLQMEELWGSYETACPAGIPSNVPASFSSSFCLEGSTQCFGVIEEYSFNIFPTCAFDSIELISQEEFCKINNP